MNPVRAWNAFFFAPISARPLGAFRIVMGLIALANLAILSYDLDYWYTGVGLVQGSEAREQAGALRFSPLQWAQDPVTVRVAVATTAAAAFLVTVGWRTRMASVVLYLGMLSLHHRNVSSACGADTLIVILLFCLMLSPSDAAYSLDALRAARRRGTLAEPLIVPWAQRLIQFQACVVYFITAGMKCNGQTWFNGTALHFVLHNTEVGRFRLGTLTQYPLAVNALTHAALAAEFALAFLLWFRATRPWVIVLGLGLHAGVLLSVNIPIFGELMTACYLTFLTPEELDALLRPLDPRNWFRRKRRPAIPGRVDGPSGLRGPHSPEAVREAEPATLSARD
jgi:hypothetical protein